MSLLRGVLLGGVVGGVLAVGVALFPGGVLAAVIGWLVWLPALLVAAAGVWRELGRLDGEP